ncbi:BZ3500_MvSof-1268-A1-R1_Chr2-2g04816 [Microbotryum saponariae]|uniref:adenine phosphoribosyltransferase n=1 Tax=Microbotryum saponariae TaxID=289078 RepID=A0A2X0N4T5_9BASI|nr:BZ3500_MvSof-1268-A1-R1_Chr2-2g04816 [Microbotryum saponariae]SDA00236.1 BZ3501_MvSof-1269-A2-R1_Chr2-2g04490 [Microbotryum saponariae]
MSSPASDVELIKNKLGVHPDFPKAGIVFLDIFPLFQDAIVFETLITHFMSHIFTHTLPRTPHNKIDVVVGLDARGFLFGPILASRLGACFVPVRKAGKLPGKTIEAIYEKEYGQDKFEMQAGAIKDGQTVLCVDDLIATGGSAKAAGELITKSGGKTVEYLFVIDIQIGGADVLDAPSYSIVKA